MRYLFIMLCSVYALLNTQLSFAGSWNCYQITSAISLSPTAINISVGTPTDTVIGTTTSSATFTSFTCTDPAKEIQSYKYSLRATGTYVKTINGQRVYQSNVAGIGYSLGAVLAGPSSCSLDGWIGTGTTYNGNVNSRIYCAFSGTATLTSLSFTGKVKIQFYKIADSVSSGTVSLGTVGNLTIAPNMLDGYPTSPSITVSSFNLVAPSCTVNTPTVSVPMGTVEKREFNGVGTTVDSKTVDFNILLTCPKDLNVKLQVDGNILDASKGLLNVTPGTTSASGVAIQILFSDFPLTLSTPVLIGYPTTQGPFIIPLQARYYQSGSTITPGDANGAATFTLTYQ